VNTKTDAELVALARTGDQEAFGHLVGRYQPMAKRIALAMVTSEDVAGELVQEAMLQAYLSLDHLRDADRFRGWLYGIVLNVCRSHIRDQKTVLLSWEAMAGGVQFEAMHFPSTTPDPQEIAEEQELQRAIREAVNALSPKNRAATLLFYYGGLSLQEIATTLGASVGAVKGRLHKARKQLREQLLPVYSYGVPTDRERRPAMVKVTIADVVRAGDVAGAWSEDFHVVVLLDEAGRRILPIWIGPFEGAEIARHLLERSTFRPMTFNFMASLLGAAGVGLEEVRIEALKEDVFYATARLRTGDTVQEVDARPSDAMALALRVGSPIYVAGEVMEKAGIDLPASAGAKPRLGRGLESIARTWAEEEQRRAAPPHPCPAPDQEGIQKARQALIGFVLRGA